MVSVRSVAGEGKIGQIKFVFSFWTIRMFDDCRDEDVDILGRVSFPIPPFEETRQDLLLRLRKDLDEC